MCQCRSNIRRSRFRLVDIISACRKSRVKLWFWWRPFGLAVSASLWFLTHTHLDKHLDRTLLPYIHSPSTSSFWHCSSILVFWGTTPCILVGVNQRCGRILPHYVRHTVTVFTVHRHRFTAYCHSIYGILPQYVRHTDTAFTVYCHSI